MTSYKRTAFIIILLIIAVLTPEMAMANKVRRIAASPVPTANAAEMQTQEQTYTCDYTNPEKPVYSAKYLAIRKKGAIAKNELFETKVYIQNIGNVPWFSADSGCKSSMVSLGTERNRDRSSVFFTGGLIWDTAWASANRIKMETKRVDPNGVGVFTFWSTAPDKDGLYREYFEPVAEGITWMDSGLFSTDYKVGDPGIDPQKRDLLSYIDKSMNLAEVDLQGAKNIEIDLSEQRLWLKIGDLVIREFRCSTGKPRTPTPVGTTYILEKREVRVAGKAPHYIMPKWMMFRKGGFGIHALPSLANDHGVFWREALNHIGSARSHGCVRLLPKDAEFAYNFADVGTKVVVHR
jgi:hypothetical protein